MATNISGRAHDQNNSLFYESLESRYMRMIVESNEIPWQYNIVASAGHWVLLAGYLVIPGTFTSLQKSGALKSGLNKSEAGAVVLDTIQNPPLLAVACVFCLLGLSIMGWLFWEYQSNYIWLVNRVFMPTLLNALAGLLTTIVSIYTGHDGVWSIMSLLTVIALGLSVACSLCLVIIYKFGKLEKLKREHIEATRAHPRSFDD